MLKKLDGILKNLMPLITPTSVVIGVLLAAWLEPFAYLIPWIFALMTFAGALSLNFRDFTKVVMHPVPILVCIVILHFLMPAIAWGVGNIFYSDDIYTITGLILSFVIPTGIVSFMWVTIYRGNIALTLSIILISTFLSPFIVPQVLSLFVGANVQMDVWAMMQGLIWMLVVPSVLGMLLNQLTDGSVKESLGAPLAPFSKIGLGVVVAINSSVVAPYLRHIDAKLIFTALTVLMIALSGYIIGWIVASLLKWDRGTIVSLTFNSGMRNISAGAVLAVAYFPPPVALPVVLGMLFQQILASLFGKALFHYYKMGEEPGVGPGEGK